MSEYLAIIFHFPLPIITCAKDREISETLSLDTQALR
jgi:hypothetical protein